MKEMATVSQWEEFPVGPDTAADEMHVTLSKKGEILVGAVAFEKLGKPDTAVLLFDKVNSRIGLLPSNRHASNAYPLKTKANVRYRMVRAARFCRHHGIKVDRTVAFCNAEIDGDGILVLDLRSTRGVGKG